MADDTPIQSTPVPGPSPISINVLPVPTIGRIVHYYTHGSLNGDYPAGQPRAAIITQLPAGQWAAFDSTVGLTVFTPTGFYLNPSVAYGPGEPGHWGWPPQDDTPKIGGF